MNYFELYDLPVSLQPDLQLVKQRFYQLSRKYHPDFFSNDSEDAREEALEKSAAVNKAFKIFNNRDETLRYVLMEKGLLEEEEKYALSPDFLMEMMELNEAAMEEERGAVEEKVKQIQDEIYAPVKAIIENYQEGVTSQEALLQVKDYYFRKKYLNRILAGFS